jgi:heme-degrading monooxygenase HmoA
MHGRVATYTYPGDAHELAQKAEDELLPIFQSQPGFKDYAIVVTDEKIISFSAWDTAESAETANSAAASWVQENMQDNVELKKTHVGEILVSTALGVSTKAGIMA